MFFCYIEYKERTGFIAPIYIAAGEFELETMA